MSKMSPDEYAREQRAKISRLGLDNEEAINDNERQWNEREALMRSLPSNPKYDGHPPRMTREKAVERGRVDGYCDAALQRPSSACVRWVADGMSANNREHFEAYQAAYVEAYRKKTEHDRAA